MSNILQTKTAGEILTTVFKPKEFIIDGLLTQGLYILAGAQKIRKSWLAMDICLSIAKLREWAEQIRAQQESGTTVTAFCAENGINLKTYYYRLRKVREQCMEAAPAIVPVAIPKQSSDIRMEKNGLQISLPADISVEMLIALVQELYLIAFARRSYWRILFMRSSVRQYRFIGRRRTSNPRAFLC